MQLPTNLTFLVVGGCFIVLGQLTTAVIAYLKERHRENKLEAVLRHVKQVAETQIETRHALNSRLTELVDTVRASAHASGMLEGKAQQLQANDNQKVADT